MRALSGTAIALMVVFCLVLTGCQSARYVLRESDRGVVAIPSNSTTWPINYREQADALMQQHFPDGYVVEKEEEVVVGEVTQFHENTNDQLTDQGDRGVVHAGGRSGWSETSNKREVRISYRRATPTASPEQTNTTEATVVE